MNAAFFTPGTITRHSAFSSSSCGMPLSGAAMISVRTSADVFNRLAALSPPYISPAPRPAIPIAFNVLRIDMQSPKVGGWLRKVSQFVRLSSNDTAEWAGVLSRHQYELFPPACLHTNMRFFKCLNRLRQSGGGARQWPV